MSRLLKRILKNAKWENKAFPSTQEWGNTYEKWLSFISEQGQMDRFKSRICPSEKSSNKAFAEICAAYYFDKVLNYKIVEWEPKGKNNKIGEFVAELPCKTKLFCEVKSPGWERDFVERNNFDRIKQPKYQHAEIRSYDNARGVMYAIEDSYEKYKSDTTNLLIIVDDFWAPNYQDGYFGVDKALYATKLPKTHVASVKKQWFSPCWEDVDLIWNELIKQNYINDDGIILDKFNSDNESVFSLDIDFGKNHVNIKKLIFDVIRFQNYEGLFVSDNYKYLSGLASLNVQQPNDVQYYLRVFDNHKASNRLPGYFVTDTIENAFKKRRVWSEQERICLKD